MEETKDFTSKANSSKKALKNSNKNQNESSNSAVPDFIQKLFRLETKKKSADTHTCIYRI